MPVMTAEENIQLGMHYITVEILILMNLSAFDPDH